MITSRSGRPVIGNLHVQGRPCKNAHEFQQQYCISIKTASALRKAFFVSMAAAIYSAALIYLNFAQMPYTLHNKWTPEGHAVPTDLMPWTCIGISCGGCIGAALYCAPTRGALRM